MISPGLTLCSRCRARDAVVSRELAEIAGDKFYDPVRFRFVERADGTYEMECQRVEQ